MTRALVTAVILTYLTVIVIQAAYSTPPDGFDITVTCLDGTAHVDVGDHEVGMSSYRLEGDDGTFKHFDWQEPLQIGDASWLDIWITLDGTEVDPKVQCTTTTSTSMTTSTTPPTVALTTTTSTVPPPTTTTTYSDPPATTTTTSPLQCPICPPPVTLPPSITDAKPDTCIPECHPAPICPTPPEPDPTSPTLLINLDGWDWLGVNGLLWAAIPFAYVLTRRRKESA